MGKRVIVTHDAGAGTMIMETCCRCQAIFCMTEDIYNVCYQRKEQGKFYCPNGHEMHYVSGETELDKLRRERDRLKQNEAYLQDVLSEVREKAKREKAALKGKVTKMENRAKNGVCLHCNRTFPNLHAHMKTKHGNIKCEAVH